MSMYNADYDGGTPVGQHNVGPPIRGTTRETPGVAKPYTGAPGESRGTDETMGTGIGGTLTNEGVPKTPPPTLPQPKSATDPKAPGSELPEPSATTKVMEGVKEVGEQAVSAVTDAIDKLNQNIK